MSGYLLKERSQEIVPGRPEQPNLAGQGMWQQLLYRKKTDKPDLERRCR
jgi:hypothetical protein